MLLSSDDAERANGAVPSFHASAEYQWYQWGQTRLVIRLVIVSVPLAPIGLPRPSGFSLVLAVFLPEAPTLSPRTPAINSKLRLSEPLIHWITRQSRLARSGTRSTVQAIVSDPIEAPHLFPTLIRDISGFHGSCCFISCATRIAGGLKMPV